MGKLKHPECGNSWYVSPKTYISRSFSEGIRFGSEAARDKSGDGLLSLLKIIVSSVAGGIGGFTWTLTWGIVLFPIQAIISLSQKKHS